MFLLIYVICATWNSINMRFILKLILISYNFKISRTTNFPTVAFLFAWLRNLVAKFILILLDVHGFGDLLAKDDCSVIFGRVSEWSSADRLTLGVVASACGSDPSTARRGLRLTQPVSVSKGSPRCSPLAVPPDPRSEASLAPRPDALCTTRWSQKKISPMRSNVSHNIELGKSPGERFRLTS